MLLALFFMACGKEGSGSSSDPLSILAPDRMAGCYAREKGGRAGIKISKQSGHYYGALRKSSGWEQKEAPLIPATEEVLKKLFGKDAPLIEESLIAQNGPFGFFRVKSGSTMKHKDPDSDYLAFVFFGGGAVFRVSCD
jgi:hypothetical protein